MSSNYDPGSVGEVDGMSNHPTFWDLKQYTHTVHRVEHANKLCSDLATMIHERAHVEKMYVNMLNQWSLKWKQNLNSGHEYGTTKQAWYAFCEEAEHTADIHQKIRERLVNEIESSSKAWQKEHFHHTGFPPNSIKEAKQFDKDFSTVQKPWSQLYKQSQKEKRKYHEACKVTRSCNHQAQNARNDSNTTTEQHIKLQERIKKAEAEEVKTLKAYKSSLMELDGDSRRYMYDMSTIFERAQEFEKIRLSFFIEIFTALCQVLDTSKIPELPNVARQFQQSISEMSPDSDLQDWSAKQGADMIINIPGFEEYRPELRDISKSQGKSALKELGGDITLTRISNADSRGGSHASINGSHLSETNYNDGSLKYVSAQINPTGHDDSHSNDTMQRARHITGDSNDNSDTDSYAPRTISTSHDQRESQNNSSRPPISNSQGSIYNPEPRVSTTSRPSTYFTPNSTPVQTPRQSPPSTPQPTIAPEDYLQRIRYDDGSPGIPVIALYDYVGVEEDELTFTAGSQLEQLSDADQQGWCKGRLDGLVGLYPANYVKAIENY